MNVENKNHIWSKKQLLVLMFVPILIVLLFFFVAISFNGWENSYVAMQEGWFLQLNDFFAILSIDFWANLTHLGDGAVLLLLLSFLIIWRTQAWAAIVATIPLASILSITGKILFAIPRPAAVLDNDSFNIIGYAITTDTSLPSGHAITIFAAITAITIIFTPPPQLLLNTNTYAKNIKYQF